MIPTIEIVEYYCPDCDYEFKSKTEVELCPICDSKELKEWDRYFEADEKEFEYE